MIDVDQQIAASHRSLNPPVSVGELRTLTIAQTYDTDLDDLWDACTNPERIPRWFLPVTGDLKEGGTYALEGNAHGTIEACDAPNSFKATWEFGDMVSWIEVVISPDPAGGTRFELRRAPPRRIDQLHARRVGDNAGVVARPSVGKDRFLHDAVHHGGHERGQRRHQSPLVVEGGDNHGNHAFGLIACRRGRATNCWG